MNVFCTIWGRNLTKFLAYKIYCKKVLSYVRILFGGTMLKRTIFMHQGIHQAGKRDQLDIHFTVCETDTKILKACQVDQDIYTQIPTSSRYRIPSGRLSSTFLQGLRVATKQKISGPGGFNWPSTNLKQDTWVLTERVVVVQYSTTGAFGHIKYRQYVTRYLADFSSSSNLPCRLWKWSKIDTDYEHWFPFLKMITDVL